MWALTEPRIPGDFLLLDEAQDTNPVVEQVFNAQRGHAQLVMSATPPKPSTAGAASAT